MTHVIKFAEEVIGMNTEINTLRIENESLKQEVKEQKELISSFFEVFEVFVSRGFGDFLKNFKSPKNAKLPLEYREDKLKYMDFGEEGYCVPWAVTVSANGNLWINTNHTVSKNCFGTSNLKIKRVIGGFEIVANSGYRFHKWDSGSQTDSTDNMPVVKFN